MGNTYICTVLRPGDPQATYGTTYLEDALLGWREKGVLSYLLTRPPGWVLDVGLLQKAAKNGREAVQTALGVLEVAHYLHRYKIYGDGRILAWVHLVFPFKVTLDAAVLKKLFPEYKEQGFLCDIIEPGQGTTIVYTSAKYHTGDKAKSAKGADTRNVHYMKPAVQLAKFVLQQKNIRTNGRKLAAWAKQFRLLHEEDSISKGRIKEALRWYGKNAGRQFVPVVESGTSFRAKFTKLEDAMGRADTITSEMKAAWQQLAEAWPPHKHRGMREAERIYYSFFKDMPPIEELLGIIDKHKATSNWCKDNGKYIPTLHRWLRHGSWEDVLDGAQEPDGGTTVSGIRVGH